MVSIAMSFSRVSLCLLFLLSASLHSSCSNTSPDASEKASVAVLPDISFSQSADVIEVYDSVEVQINIAAPAVRNPFTEVFVTGKLGQVNHDENNFVLSSAERRCCYCAGARYY